MGLFSRRKGSSAASEKTLDGTTTLPSSANYRRPTFLRTFIALLYIVSTVMLILVQIGNIRDMPVIRNTFFLKLDLADIIPSSVSNAQIINSIARTIGLHDFYQVGLWNFCEGYNGEGVTYCSPSQTMYWFNPVEIILNELLAGATIALPSQVNDALDLVRTASRWMFACFLAGTILTFLCIFLTPLGFSKKPRWEHKARRVFLRQLPETILTFLALLLVAVASVIATVMFIIFRNVFTSQPELNIQATLGTQMLVFMWIPTGCNLIGFLMQIGTCCGVCCCTGRRKAEKRGRLPPKHEMNTATASPA